MIGLESFGVHTHSYTPVGTRKGNCVNSIAPQFFLQKLSHILQKFMKIKVFDRKFMTAEFKNALTKSHAVFCTFLNNLYSNLLICQYCITYPNSQQGLPSSQTLTGRKEKCCTLYKYRRVPTRHHKPQRPWWPQGIYTSV